MLFADFEQVSVDIVDHLATTLNAVCERCFHERRYRAIQHSCGLVLSTPVRKSFTNWYGCRT